MADRLEGGTAGVEMEAAAVVEVAHARRHYLRCARRWQRHRRQH